MAVRKLSRVKTRKAVRQTKAARDRAKLSGLALPTAPKKAEEDILRYTGLLWGREKIGKTIALSGFPDAIFLTTEPGTKGLEIHEFNSDDGAVRSWPIMLRAVELLEAAGAGHPFRTVAIDLADRAYDMCLDHTCQKLGIPYPGVSADGSEDWGKSWRAVRMEFLGAIHRLEQAGYGVWLTSHAQEQTIRTRSGDQYTRIVPTMSKQARGVVEPIVDFFFYCEYMRSRDGAVERVIITQGDETIWGGGRKSPWGRIPQFLPLREEHTFEVIEQAFLGKGGGIDPGSLLATRETFATAKEFVNKQKARRSLARVKGKAKPTTRKRGR